jgi:hypothetical protein
LLSSISFLLYHRYGFELDDISQGAVDQALLHRSSSIERVEVPQLTDISSTTIRKIASMLETDSSLDENVLHPAVRDYIISNCLYQGSDSAQVC